MNEKILVIGNGSSVMDNEFGPLIDLYFDTIIRFNRFKTKGYEKYVGTKTNVWIVADIGFDKWVLNKEKGIEGSESDNKFEYNNILIYCPSFKIDDFLNSFDDKVSESDFKDTGIIKVISSDIENEIEKVVNFKPAWPSTGLIALTLCIKTNLGKIYCHGFDICSPKYEFIEYFENSKNKSTSWARRPNRPDHHLDAEEEYFNYLLKI